MYDTATHTRLHSETKADAPHFLLENLRSHAGSQLGAATVAGSSPLLQIEVSAAVLFRDVQIMNRVSLINLLVSALIVGLYYLDRNVLPYIRCLMQIFLAFRDSLSSH